MYSCSVIVLVGRLKIGLALYIYKRVPVLVREKISERIKQMLCLMVNLY